VRPNAAEASGEKSAAATARSLDASMVIVIEESPGSKCSTHVGLTLLCT
jgi:hypothetical protein